MFVCFNYRQLPTPYSKSGTNGGTSIPLPATVLVTRRCPPDKVRPLPPTPGQQTGKNIYFLLLNLICYDYCIEVCAVRLMITIVYMPY